MIKFFRHIRKSLIEKNQMGKYFKYAIGEILLVVIGILIALQINNWNEQRKTRQSEVSYLKSIKTDLEGDKQTIQYIINTTKVRIDAYEKLISQLKAFDTITDSRPLFNLMRDHVGFVDLKVQDHTIETLKNSGNIEIIRSKPIRRAIQIYYDTVEVIYVQQNFMNTYVVTNDMDKFFNYLEIEKGIETNTKVPFDTRSREALPDAYAFLNHWVSNLNGFVDLLERLELLNTDLVNQINSNYSE